MSFINFPFSEIVEIVNISFWANFSFLQLTNPGEVSHSEKGICCDSENYGSEGLSKPSSEARLNIGHLPSAKESANPHITEEEDDDPDVYYFESDHVALKHNKEYV